jgi:hypothetical protein
LIIYQDSAVITDFSNSNKFGETLADEEIVGLVPKGKNSGLNIGRTLVGGVSGGSCNPENSNCFNKYLLIFVGKTAEVGDMVSVAKAWGVHESQMVMFDGSASSQMKSGSVEVYGENYYGATKRNIPHTILTYKAN